MITVSGLLEDGCSVIALDVSLNPIQKIVERISSTTEGSQAFVIDESGIVVAHSSPDQIGMNYLSESYNVGNVATGKFLKEGKLKFDVDTADGSYSVYADSLDGGWYSVSLINADVWYGPLQRTIILFSIVLALTKALKDTFRTNDIIMRLGGDEFGVFAIGVNSRDIGEISVRRLFKAIEATEIPRLQEGQYCVSVGAAVCSRIGKTTFEELYARADQALYLSKKEAGNFVTFN